ncbi:MAG: hypothetical protein R2939_16600 [Kofleriaceae bacterium]
MTRRRAALALLAATGCAAAARPEGRATTHHRGLLDDVHAPGVSWLPGLIVLAASDGPSERAAERLRGAARATAPCTRAAGAHEVAADLVLPAGDEVALASLDAGVVVLDRDDAVIARAAPLPCGGSADDLIDVVVGDAGLDRPVIALRVVLGGHAETTQSVWLYRVGRGGELGPIFVGVTEEQVGDDARAGELSVEGAELRYRAPDEPVARRWWFDPAQERYQPR